MVLLKKVVLTSTFSFFCQFLQLLRAGSAYTRCFKESLNRFIPSISALCAIYKENDHVEGLISRGKYISVNKWLLTLKYEYFNALIGFHKAWWLHIGGCLMGRLPEEKDPDFAVFLWRQERGPPAWCHCCRVGIPCLPLLNADVEGPLFRLVVVTPTTLSVI